MDYRDDCFEILRDFLSYHETVKSHSKNTVDEYYLDLRNFFRYIKIIKNKVPRTLELNEISISDVDLELIKSVTLTDVYEYMSYLNRDRIVSQRSRNPEYGISATSRARKLASIRSFYNYLTVKTHLIDNNPIQDIDTPKLRKSLPKVLSLDESLELLNNVDGKNKERDFCILTLFLNCGLRISELIGLNISDVHGDYLRILGKGNKERIVYLNDACIAAINSYLAVRHNTKNEKALFLSQRDRRISRSAVNLLVKNHLRAAGIDSTQYSSHKLRHTAATLMLQNGVDVRTLQEVLGHEHLNTTQIYTHIDNESLRVAAKANPLGKVKPPSK